MLPILLAETEPPAAAQAVAILLLLALVAAMVFWGAIFHRRLEGQPLLPTEPRTPVPWGGGDVLAVLAAKLVFTALVLGLMRWWLGLELTKTPLPDEAATPEVAHAVLQAMASGGPWVLLLCVISAVVVAPVAEEFLFRVLLQGWLESGLERAKFLFPALQPLSYGAAGPILFSSLLFAAVHFRTAGTPPPSDVLVAMLLGNALIWLLTVAFAVAWLHYRA
ncbi:MAG: CPBP family intramembrane glutamic endopeptidase, partial [Patescibacteria group bacterium]|nr:CPBP family intramembrane glutamic endopeptidase [Patescibacteria group bacterium]